MRKFWRDYAEIYKLSGQFYRNHWFGVIVVNVLIIAFWYSWFFLDDIKDAIRRKFKKEES